MSFGMKCTSRSRDNEVLPDPDDNRHFDKYVLNTGDRNVYSTHNEDEDVKTESPSLGKDSVPRPGLMTEDIRADEEEENLRYEWKELAEYIDRFLFFIFTAIHFFIIFLIYVTVPRMHASDASSS